ncbi:hypothetical protein [Paraburkholderia sp. D1E]|uniref:hypothetical protein n=1 Tax=Paraburkholderia sp. D1E TaxID=3461398 RepID=UPI0040453C76
MPRIPLGNQGDVTSTPPQQVQTSTADFGGLSAAAEQQLGTTMEDAGQKLQAQQQRLNDDLQRTSAATAFQQHDMDMKLALQRSGQRLQSGEIDQTEYQSQIDNAKQQSFDSTIGALPDTHYKRVATIQSGALNSTVALSAQAAITKNSQQLIGANANTMLDTAGKNIEIDPGSIDATVASTKAGYLNAAQSAGVPLETAQKTAQSWAENQYAQHATTAVIQARSNGDLNALNQLQHDLTAPDGFYADKMNPTQRNQALATVVSQQLSLGNQQDAEQRARETQATSAFNGGLDLMNQGKQFSPAYQKQLTAATAGTSLEGEAQQLITQAGKNAGFSTLPLPQMQAAIQADQQTANTPGVGTDPATAAAVKQRQQIYTSSVEAYKKDPWNAALDRGAIQSIPPIDESSVPNLLTSLQQRSQSAGVVDQAAGRKVSLLTPDESQQVLQTVAALPVDAQAQVMNGIGGAFGDAARIGDLAQQWKEKNPAAALALKAGAGGGNGDPLITVSGNPVSAFILSGAQAEKDKTVKVDETVATGMKATIANTIGQALPPEQAADARDMAYLIAVGSAARNGRPSPNSTDVQDGINAATGGMSTTGGLQAFGQNKGKPNAVAMPYGWNENDFQNSVKTASATNIENTVGGKAIDTVYANGQPIPVADFMAKFPSYQLTRVGVRGTYAIGAGSKFVNDSTGKPVLVHLMLGQKPQAAAPTSDVGSVSTADMTPNPF